MLSQHMAETAALIKHRYGKTISLGIILGSGLGAFADELQNAARIPYQEIPHFHASTVQGHGGNLVLGEITGDSGQTFSVACMQGRFHFYEGHDMHTVVYPVRVMYELGARNLVVTNAAGGIRESFEPGTLMLIEDHLNLMGANPLIGKNWEPGPRFPDMCDAYASEYRELAKKVARQHDIPLQEGIYAGLSGPSYETPAEIRMLRTLGADAVGMSTVPEVIAARHLGMKVLGLSCITNPAAGVLPNHRLSHQEVIEAGDRVRDQFILLLREVTRQLVTEPVATA